MSVRLHELLCDYDNRPMFLDSSPKLRLGIRLLTGLVWLAVLASVAWWALRLFDAGKPVPVNARELSTEPRVAALNWPTLAARFGVAAVAQAQDVRVLGVVLKQGGDRAVLAFEGSNKPPVVATVNMQLPDGSLVRDIGADFVTLQRSGGDLRLPVPAIKEARLPPASGAAPPPPPVPGVQASLPPPPPPQFNPAKLNGVTNIGPMNVPRAPTSAPAAR